jgi:outer membrane lipoprotein-sorting protein
MSENQDKLKRIIKKLQIDTAPDENHRQKLRRQVIEEFGNAKHHSVGRFRSVSLKLIRNPLIDLAAAAVLLITVLFGINALITTPTWADVMHALNVVPQVHATYTIYLNDKEKEEYEVWLKRPNYRKTISPWRTVIDNGKQRLEIKEEEKTAKMMYSIAEYNPIEYHDAFDFINMFRNKVPHGWEIKRLAEESNSEALVFEIIKQDNWSGDLNNTIKGKAWTNSESLLPYHIELTRTYDKYPDKKEKGIITFDYEQIPKEVFSFIIPEGYTVVEPEQPSIASGHVFDENDQPVTGAVVYVVDGPGWFSKETTTNNNGYFEVKLYPEAAGRIIALPLFFRAFLPDQPNSVAWTVVDRKWNSNPTFDPNLPGKVGQIKFRDDNSLLSVSDIVLKMEPAAKVFGKVTNENGQPLGFVNVTMLSYQPKVNSIDGSMAVWAWAGMGNLGGQEGNHQPHTITDENGLFEFTNLPRFTKGGSLDICADLPGYTRTYSRLRKDEYADLIQVDIQMFKAGITITGSLKDNYGNILPDRYITVNVRANQNDASCRAVTDANGCFYIENCPVSPQLKIFASLSTNNISPFEKEKYAAFKYYPDISKTIKIEDGQLNYEINLVAKKPELTVDVNVTDTSGNPVAYLPVQISGQPGTISPVSPFWVNAKLTSRTDENGFCRFTEVPDVNGLHIIAPAHFMDPENDPLTQEQASKINHPMFRRTELPLEITPGKKHYTIEATLLTEEEYERKRNNY